MNPWEIIFQLLGWIVLVVLVSCAVLVAIVLVDGLRKRSRRTHRTYRFKGSKGDGDENR